MKRPENDCFHKIGKPISVYQTNDPAMEIYSWFDYFRQNIFKTRGQIEREPSETICGFDSACGSEVHCDCRFQRILIAS